MKFAFPNSRSAERFAESIADSGGTRRHHSRGQTDEELNRLVAIGNRLSAARIATPVDSEFRVGLRAMLVATAERDGIGRTAAETEPDPIIEAAARRPRLGRRIRARGAIIIGVAAGAMAVSGISAASESAFPGDVFYTVKRQTERAQLAIAGSDVTRGQLSLDFARTRLSEAVAMKGGEREFALVLDDMDADTRKGVRLLTTSAAAQQDTAPLATLDGFAIDQRKVLHPALEKLSTANRERAAVSLGLLQDVVKRTESLRTGLACDEVTPAGSDALGPKLRDCTTPAEDQNGSPQGTSPTQQQQQHSDSGRPGTKQADQSSTPRQNRTKATTDPETTGSAEPRTSKSAAETSDTPVGTTGVSPTPTDTMSTTDIPGTEEDGVLGGLLSDLF
ncbi:DUF5667 domain-containing protein [Actinoplanes derwentensis]|uniref:DUF5667 domain-containing protein n=1 Tax=Actinoplanes derwentensis TaxID=113562 RepID=A0A1H2CZU1_9ACTN|nr:DUF5667 domain-containing protein [Actinoplanes derwentensis]GID86672.1 hypothetical protein Ade03nite_55960 [Actinoplanes derwentensis]SDT76020.1 hypothetical protein SAMN04489716_7486 [Actinoplanes derwentensis]